MVNGTTQSDHQRRRSKVVTLIDGRLLCQHAIGQGAGGNLARRGLTRPQSVNFQSPPRPPLSGAIYELFNTATEVDLSALTRAFYQTHADDFDFLYVWTDFTVDMGGAFAFHLGVQNDVSGIGRQQFNHAHEFGSARNLESVIQMGNILGAYPDDPTILFLGLNTSLSLLAHETGHRWLAFVRFDERGQRSTHLLGRDLAHWSFFFNTESTMSTPKAPQSSSLEGNAWRDNRNGTFTSVGLINGYSPLDQYLMGLRAASEVEPSFVITPLSRTGSASDPPGLDYRVEGTKQRVTVQDIRHYRK